MLHVEEMEPRNLPAATVLAAAVEAPQGNLTDAPAGGPLLAPAAQVGTAQTPGVEANIPPQTAADALLDSNGALLVPPDAEGTDPNAAPDDAAVAEGQATVGTLPPPDDPGLPNNPFVIPASGEAASREAERIRSLTNPLQARLDVLNAPDAGRSVLLPRSELLELAFLSGSQSLIDPEGEEKEEKPSVIPLIIQPDMPADKTGERGAEPSAEEPSAEEEQTSAEEEQEGEVTALTEAGNDPEDEEALVRGQVLAGNEAPDLRP